MHDNKKISVYLLAAYAAILLILGSLIVFRINSIGGYYWDFTAHMLYAKALASTEFYSSIANHTAALAILYENIFYVEWFRAPLMSVLNSITRGSHSKLFVSEKTISRAERLVKTTHTDSRWLDLRNPPYTKDFVMKVQPQCMIIKKLACISWLLMPPSCLS